MQPLADEREEAGTLAPGREVAQQGVDPGGQRVTLAEEDALDARPEVLPGRDHAACEHPGEHQASGSLLDPDEGARRLRRGRDDGDDASDQERGQDAVERGRGDQAVDVEQVEADDGDEEADRNERLGEHRRVVQPPPARHQRGQHVRREHGHQAHVHAIDQPLQLPSADGAGRAVVPGENEEHRPDEGDVHGEHETQRGRRRERRPEHGAHRRGSEEREAPRPENWGRLGRAVGEHPRDADDERQHHRGGDDEDDHPGVGRHARAAEEPGRMEAERRGGEEESARDRSARPPQEDEGPHDEERDGERRHAPAEDDGNERERRLARLPRPLVTHSDAGRRGHPLRPGELLLRQGEEPDGSDAVEIRVLEAEKAVARDEAGALHLRRGPEGRDVWQAAGALRA